ncbi:hypothetical protein HPP92_007140 [Vanilla planifolia]|uniref:Uncharacterized protein n=1 Tax=Vanilla planifolia TaxID=51239 RepID=A0A835RLU2_VANPL|nr:hypothetical protein HPP92_007379 [Vanilla planifolia]KAG0490277.1 hypothetical protein HPP92_007140 [Vanilla planifolia]
MASAFKTSVTGLQKELEALITENQIQARIDSHNKILYARHADQRNTTFQRVLQTGIEFEKEVRSMLLRSNLIKHEHNQRASGNSKLQRGIDDTSFQLISSGFAHLINQLRPSLISVH